MGCCCSAPSYLLGWLAGIPGKVEYDQNFFNMSFKTDIAGIVVVLVDVVAVKFVYVYGQIFAGQPSTLQNACINFVISNQQAATKLLKFGAT